MDGKVMDKITFYSIDGKLINNLSSNKKEVLDSNKEIKTSKRFNTALKRVTQKDINYLKNKVIDIVKKMKKTLATNSVFMEDEIDDKIENIDEIISKTEEVISKLIIDKNNIKLGIFSTNKKAKKLKVMNLDRSINYLSKSLNDIISIKNEYNKLIDRSKNISELPVYPQEEEKKTEDPLERTINFYMNKK